MKSTGVRGLEVAFVLSTTGMTPDWGTKNSDGRWIRCLVKPDKM